MLKSRLILFVLVLSCLGAAGHNVRHYDVSSGLSENTVKGITQDIYGYMWFGTQDGLNLFNGREFISFGCSYHDMGGRDEGSLNILSVLLHSDGKRIWLICRSTVTLFDPDTKSYSDIVFPEKVAPTCAAYAQDGMLWIGTESGLYTYSESDGSVKGFPMSLGPDTDNGINAILCSSGGIIWICAESGFFRYLPFNGGFEKISDKNAVSAMEDSSGVIWVGLWYEGCAKYNSQTNRLDLLSRTRENGETFQTLRVRNLLEESPGNVLLCTNRGLFRYSVQAGRLRKIFLTSHRATDNVYSCYKDREGGIWIGTYFKGLYYLLPKGGILEAFTPENTPEFFHGSAVSSFCEDGQGNIWTCAENGGLSLFSPADGTFHPLAFPNPANNLHALCIDRNYLYVGSFAQGMIRIDLTLGKTKVYQSAGIGSIPDNHVFSLLRLRNGCIIVGTRRGCAVFDPKQDKFSGIPRLEESFIYGVCEDAKGNIWFADYYDGLHRLEGINGVYRHYEHVDGDPSSLPCDRLVNVQTDDNGDIWISSDGGGLCRYDGISDSFVPFVIKDSSHSRRISVVYGCLNDKNGNLWISSNHGIWCCDKTGNGVHYTEAEGLQSNQFNYKAAFRSSNGKLFFGGINGFNVIDPDAAPAESPQPLLTATVSWNKDDGDVFNSPRITETGVVTIPCDITHFNINFECLSYLAPDNTVFKYSVDGSSITYTTDKGLVSFADFPYGKHDITVTAVTSTGERSYNTVRIIIDNIPPIYLSSLAKILYAVLFVLAVVWGYRFIGKRKMEKAENEAYQAKLNFFTQISHEIKTPVALIKGPLDIVMRESLSENARHHLEIIRKNVGRLQQLTGELLDFKKISAEGYSLNLKSINPGQTLGNVVGNFVNVGSGKIDISLKIGNNVGTCRIDPEAFTKIASNLISNSVKHTRSVIRIELTRRRAGEHEMLHLCVKDDGEGIPHEQALKVFDSFYQVKTEKSSRIPGIGLGLSMVKLLAEKHNGRAYVDTGYENGCCVCVDIPYIPAEAADAAGAVKAGSSGVRMLIAEDNLDMLDFLRSTLQEEYTVYEAHDGDEALAVLKDKDVDIIISDIYMPGSDGFTLLKAVRDDEMLCHIPFILLSAESALDTKIKGLDYGANAYIEKPFSVEQLFATIQNILKDREIMRKSFRMGDTLSQARSAEHAQDSKFLEKISGLILERMGESWITVEELAENMNVSHSSLQRKIKALTGLSPVEFVRNVKLRKAAELLASGEYRVNEVCYAIGFSKPSYFSSCFKKLFGVLPKDYVKGK